MWRSPDFKRSMDRASLQNYFSQFILTLGKIRESIDFLYKHRLWEGFWSYGWVVRFLVVAGLIFSLKFIQIVYNWMERASAADPIAALSSMGDLMSTFAHEGYSFFYHGAMKYILLVLMEIIIFHVVRRSIAILTNEDSEASLTAFIQAQKRMINVVFRVFILELVFKAIVKAAFWALGPIDFLEPGILFLIQCYFLGFAVLDNYHEQFGMSIKQSFAYGKQYLGVSLALGIFLQLAFYIPIAGAVAGPLIAAVTVSLVMFQLSDLHLRRGGPMAVELGKSDEIV